MVQVEGLPGTRCETCFEPVIPARRLLAIPGQRQPLPGSIVVDDDVAVALGVEDARGRGMEAP